ncbi:MAG: hypothetical protein V7605_1517 [Acidimicrobiaceae bacterium]|jgi:uncharacterized protein YndB with AHSA1/START domain
MTTGTEGGMASVTVGAPAEALWDLVTDVTRTGEWSPEATGGAWIDGATGPAVGARFKGTNRRGRTRWSTTCEVTAAAPGREFTFVTGRPGKPETVWRYVFEPDGDGGTQVTESFELVKPLGAVSNFVTRVTTGVKDRRADLEANIGVSLAKLKAIAEA